jgi:hypothetical protein
MPSEADFLYSSLEEAVAELSLRRSDKEFCNFVDNLFIKRDIPDPLQNMPPRAVFARYIASPTLEFEAFYSLAVKSGLSPLMLEFASDKLVARNWEKFCLCKMSFVKREQMTGQKIAVNNLINFNLDEGKALKDIQTKSGESLVDFHHQLMQKFLNGAPLEIYDFSEWFIPNRGSERWSYYLRYISLFICHGILFENFLMDRKEIEFTTQVVMPAFKTITDVTGRKPLIVRALPSESENEPYWCYYDKQIKDL